MALGLWIMPHKHQSSAAFSRPMTIIFVFYKSYALSYVLYKTILWASERFCFVR